MLFTITAASSVAVPVLAYAVGRERITRSLESLRSWLTGAQQGRDRHAATADRRRPDRPGTEGVKEAER